MRSLWRPRDCLSSGAQGGTVSAWAGGDRILMMVSCPSAFPRFVATHWWECWDTGSRETSLGKEKVQIVPLYSVFAFPHHGINTWTPEPSRPYARAGEAGAGPQGRLRHVGWSGRGRAEPPAGFLSSSSRLGMPRSVQAGKQTEQQMLCEILGLEFFFF